MTTLTVTIPDWVTILFGALLWVIVLRWWADMIIAYLVKRMAYRLMLKDGITKVVGEQVIHSPEGAIGFKAPATGSQETGD